MSAADQSADGIIRRRIYLLRHGHVNYIRDLPRLGDPDLVPLSEEGQAQASAMGAALADVPIDRALCSPLARSRETAQRVLAAQTAAPAPALEDDIRLREMQGPRDPGVLATMDIRQAGAAITASYKTASLPGARMGHGGELFSDAAARLGAALAEYCADETWRTLLLVAHGGVNRVVLAQAAGLGLAGLDAFDQDMGCANIIDLDTEDGVVIAARLRGVNITPWSPLKADLRLSSMEATFRGA